MKDTKIVHLISDSGEKGDHKIFCLNKWTASSWLPPYREATLLGGGIYINEDEDNNQYLFTFDDPVASCPVCIKLRFDEISLKNKEKMNKFLKSRRPNVNR